MKDHKDEILGVIQLINRKIDFASRIDKPEQAEALVVPFGKELEPLVMSLASRPRCRWRTTSSTRR